MKSRTLLIILIVLVIGGAAATVFFVRRGMGSRPLVRGDVAMEAGKFDKAAELAREYIGKNPDNWRGYYLLGRAQRRLGRYEEARAALSKAVAGAGADKIGPVIQLAAAYVGPVQNLAKGGATVTEKLLKEAIELLGRNRLEENISPQEQPVPDGAIDVLVNAKNSNPQWALDLDEKIGMSYQLGADTWKSLAERYRNEAEAADVAQVKDVAVQKRQAQQKAEKEAVRASGEAIRSLLAVVEEDASRVDASSILVELCIQQKDTKSLAAAAKAIRALKKPPAIAALKLVQYEARSPGDDESFADAQSRLWLLTWNLDDLLVENPDEKEIKIALSDALRSIKNPLTPDVMDKIKSRQKKGWQSEQGRLERVDRLLDEVLKASPNNYNAKMLVVLVMIQRHQYVDAERYLNQIKTDYSQQPAAFIIHADVCTKLARYSAAETSMRHVTKLDPKNQYARKFLAEALLAKGFPQRALDDAGEYYKLKPDAPDAVGLLVRAAYGGEQPKRAEEALSKALADYPNRPEMLVVVAGGYRLLGRPAKEQELMQHVAGITPVGLPGVLAVAQAMERIGRNAQAENLLRDWMARDSRNPAYPFMLGQLYYRGGRVFEAIGMFRATIGLDPTNDDYHVSLARVLLDIDDLAGCEDELEGTHSHNVQANLLREELRLRRGEDASATEQVLARVGGGIGEGIQLARLYLQRGKTEDCIKVCLKELDKTPDDIVLRLILGRAYLVQGDQPNCIKEWTAVLQAMPDRLPTYQYLADVLVRDNSPAQVAEKLSAMPGAKVTMVDMAMGGLLMRRAGGSQEAAEAYGRVIARDGVPDYFKNRARLARARALASGGDMAGAISDLDALIALANWKREGLKAKATILARRGGPQAVAALDQWKNLVIELKDSAGIQHAVRLYLAKKDFDGAIALCRQAQELLPGSTRVLMLHVEVLIKAQRPRETIALLEQMIKIEPMNMRAHMGLVKELNATNQPAEALKALDIMAATGPEARAGALDARGQLFASWGLNSKAIECFHELASGKHGEITHLQLSLGSAFAKLGDKDHANELLAKVPPHARQYVPARLLMASIADEDDRKLDILNALEKVAPTDGRILLRKVSLLMDTGQGDEGVKAYNVFRERAGKIAGTPSVASFLVFQHFMRKGDYPKALQLAQERAKELGSPRWRHLSALAALGVDPATAGGILPEVASAGFNDTMLGLVLAAKQQDKPSAQKWAARFEQFFVNSAAPAQSQPIPSRYGILVSLAAGNNSAARKYLPSATDIDIPVATELVTRGGSEADVSAEAAQLLKVTIAMDLGLLEVGRSWAMGLLTERPRCQWAAKLITRSHPQKPMLKEVVRILKPADSNLAQYTAASLLEPAESRNRIAEIYRKLAAADPGAMNLVRLQAMATETAGQPVEALVLYRKVLAAQAADTVVFNNAAYIVSQEYPTDKAQLQEALGWIEKAVQAAPAAHAYHDTRGWILFLLGQKDRARADIRSAVKGLPASVEVHYHAGIVEADAGNTDMSRWHLQAAVDRERRVKTAGGELSSNEARAAKLAAEALKKTSADGK